jgi:hypothetical protein
VGSELRQKREQLLGSATAQQSLLKEITDEASVTTAPEETSSTDNDALVNLYVERFRQDHLDSERKSFDQFVSRVKKLLFASKSKKKSKKSSQLRLQ